MRETSLFLRYTQAIAAGQAAGSQEAPHDDTAARVNNVSALSSGSDLCSTAGCGKSHYGLCKAGHIQPGFMQCSGCKLLVQSASAPPVHPTNRAAT